MRKRKPRVVWLPPDPANAVVPNEDTTGWLGTINGGPNQAALEISGSATTVNVEIPVVIDAPRPETESLSDIEDSGYRLRRIVGKIFCLGDTLDQTSDIIVIGIIAGLIVRRTDQLGVSLASQVGLNQNSCSPSERENWQDPWIWRRSWVLANPSLFTSVAAGLPDNIAWTNFMHGPSAADGPHIDQKTARIIGPEERLFLNLSATVLLGGGDPQNDETNRTLVFTELRVLASMRTSSGNRRNASR